MEPGPSYAIARTLHVAYDEADRRVRAALKDEGFGVLTEIDVAATLKEKLGVELPRYAILGACNPTLAHRALEAEPDAGLLLPCNVVVRALSDDRTLIEALDPVKQLALSESSELEGVAVEARERLGRAIAALETS